MNENKRIQSTLNRNTTFLIAGLALIGWSVAAAEPDLSKLPPAAKKENVTYAKDIRPLFEASCFRCHGEMRQRGDLRLDSLEAVLKGSEHGKVITPGSSEKSKLVIAVAQIDDESAMPPKRGPGRGGRRGPGGPGGDRAGGAGAAAAPGAPAGDAPAQPRGDGAPRRGGPGGPPATPLTAEQVGLVRAWIDQGAK